MLSAQDNELLCRVGPGTPMGNLMRQYWMPAIRSDELPAPDCPPLRVRLLGENLIAFRATSGEVGLIAERLPAPRRLAVLRPQRGRRPALRLPRLEVRRRPAPASTCPPSRPRRNFKNKVRATRLPDARAQRHRLGLHGPARGAAAAARPRSQHAPNGPQQRRNVHARLQLDAGARGRHRHRARRLPALRPRSSRRTPSAGSFDYYHGQGPRRRATPSSTRTSAPPTAPTVRRKRTPTTGASPTSSSRSTRMIPPGTLGRQAPVPRLGADGRRAHDVLGRQRADGRRRRERPARARSARFKRVQEMLPDTTGWYGRFRPGAALDNDYLIDREFQKQRRELHRPPQRLPRGPGDHREHGHDLRPLARAPRHLDTMIIRTRRALINAAQALREHGASRPASTTPEVYGQRSGGVVLPRSADWFEATAELRKAFVHHAPDAVQASLGRRGPKVEAPAG